MITIERANQIIEAFGPCTVVYECRTPEDVVEQVKKDGERSFVKYSLIAEGIHWERSDDTGELYREWKESRPEVFKRLAAIGIEMTENDLRLL